MRLYKFRSLGDEIFFCRAMQILRTGKIWCSKFWELNDPMEGVFTAENRAVVDEVFDDKQKHVIGSLSGRRALSNPLMWGYYANGFRGVAIEVEPYAEELGRVRKITYDGIPSASDGVEKILATKLKRWKHEIEYRFLKNNEKFSGLHSFGEITGIYFGNPYGNAQNHISVVGASPDLRAFLAFCAELQSMAKCKGIDRYTTHMEKSRVQWKKI